MSQDEIYERLATAVGEEFEIEPEALRREAALRTDLGIDSLDMVDLAVVVERTFGVRLGKEDLVSARTLERLAELIGSRLDG